MRIVAMILASALLVPAGAASQWESQEAVVPVVPPPPPAPPAPPVPELLPEIVPVMMGTGLFVLGAFATATIIAVLARGGVDPDPDTITGIVFSLVFGAASLVAGGYYAIGTLTGDVHVRSWNPGFQWVGAIASMAGAIAWCASLGAYLADDDFGEDSVALITIGISFYALSLFFGVDLTVTTGPSKVALMAFPLPHGGGMAAAGAF